MSLLVVGCASPTVAPVSDISPTPPTPLPPTDTQVPSTPSPIPPTPTSVPPTVTPTRTPIPISTAAPSIFDSPRGILTARGYVTLAYDVESDQVILFGGVTGNINIDPTKSSSATWAYDVAANKWIQMMPPTGPQGGAVTLAYDIESDRVILFGAMPR